MEGEDFLPKERLLGLQPSTWTQSQGLHNFLATESLRWASSGTAMPEHKAITAHTVCGSLMVEQASKYKYNKSEQGGPSLHISGEEVHLFWEAKEWNANLNKAQNKDLSYKS